MQAFNRFCRWLFASESQQLKREKAGARLAWRRYRAAVLKLNECQGDLGDANERIEDLEAQLSASRAESELRAGQVKILEAQVEQLTIWQGAATKQIEAEAAIHATRKGLAAAKLIRPRDGD